MPAFNEEALIEGTVRRAHAVLSELGLKSFEVIVVDDGSADQTGAIVKRLADELPGVRLVQHPSNRGYGAALRSGFEAAQSQTTWLLDSDGQFDCKELSLLLQKYQDNAVVAGKRGHRSDPWIRRMNNAVFFTVVQLVLGAMGADVNCGFKLFPHAVGIGLRSDGAMISTELLLRAKRSGYRIVSVPVHHLPRLAGTPTGNNWRVVLRAFGELWRMRTDPSYLSALDRVA
jgi:glycosyltransferase involved in cell wall biosynthesis